MSQDGTNKSESGLGLLYNRRKEGFYKRLSANKADHLCQDSGFSVAEYRGCRPPLHMKRAAGCNLADFAANKCDGESTM